MVNTADHLPLSHPIPRILFCHANPLHVHLHYIYESSFCSSSFAPAWQLHSQLPCSLYSLSLLNLNLSCPSDILCIVYLLSLVNLLGNFSFTPGHINLFGALQLKTLPNQTCRGIRFVDLFGNLNICCILFTHVNC